MADWGQGPPRAVVERIGRWTYCVYVSDGFNQRGTDGSGWRVWGRKRAYRKAPHVLANFLRLLDREAP